MRITQQLLFRALLVMCAMCALPAMAQERSLDSMEHRRWLSADGGPSQVGAIAQTRDGYLWLGTNDSLFRFDGMRFVRYEPPSRNTLNIVASLLVAGDELWVGLRYGGVRVIRDGEMRAFPVGDGLPDGVIYSLARDRGGAIWAAADDGLARYADGLWQRVGKAWGVAGAHARAVFTDRDGVLWAASGNRLLYLPDGSRTFVDTGLAVDTVSQIAQAPDGAIWIAERYSGTLHRAVLDQGKVASASRKMNASAIGLLFDRAGSLWISTTGQGIRYVANPTSLAALDSAKAFTVKQGLSSDFIWKMHEDSEGNLWVGTNAGLDRFRQRTLMPAAFPAGVLNFALAAGADGSLWGGPSNRPAMRMAGALVEQMAMPAPVNNAMTDSEGGVWMGGPSGIWRARGNSMERVAPLPGDAGVETPVRAMVRDAAGDVWVSINRAGLFRLHEGKWMALPPVSALASQRMPVSALAAPGGWLWFGYRDGLLVARRGNEERRWTGAEGLDIGHVTALAHHAGRIWIGGQRGVGYLDAGRFQRLQLPDNGLFNNIYAMIPVPVRDGQGVDLWLHSRSGIFQLTAAELRRAAADPQHRIGYRSFDLMGGLANDPYQVLPLPTAVRTTDGRLWFSTSGGVVWIDPLRPPSQDPGPTVVIESVSVDGARVGIAAPLSLRSGTQRITVDYTALSLSAPEQLNFRYRLDGYDADWQDAGRERQASYTGLGPGDYTFRVMALNKDGMSSTREASFSFNIALAFYREPLFLALMATLVAGSLWLAYKINMRRAADRLRDRLEERHRERERIARELHDTLLQGVQGLVLRFHAVAGSLPEDMPARTSLEQALDRADQVLVEGRDRVRDLRSGPQDLRGLQQALGALGAGMAQQSGQTFSVHVTGQVKSLLPAVLDEVYRIAHEAIVNAFAHANAGAIRAEVAYGQEVFRLTISDDGRGIDPAYLTPQGRPDHWGLRGMHERAERIGASLEVCSGGARGAMITLTLPARMAYRRRPGRRPGWRGLLSR